MTAKLKLLFGTHCHQPIGNSGHLFEEAYQKAYLPFLEVLSAHPKVKFNLHYSGVLYDWLEEEHPEVFDLLVKMVRRGQLEILSSGYYEPVLPVIPDEDKLGQIKMANDYIKEKLWNAPRGLWLTERVWEPSLPKIISKVGLDYVLVDEDHFVLAGMPEKKLSGYFITEDEGEKTNIFPINRQLRQLIPLRPPEEVVEYLGRLTDEKNNACVVFMDEGEKFGLRQGYLDELLSLLEANSSWLSFSTFSDYLDDFPARGRIYIPSASYNEMMSLASLNGDQPACGNFRNFFVKYPAANRMYKKMLGVSRRLKALSKAKTLIGGEKKEAELKQARLELFKAQSNCAYWPGLSGGLKSDLLRQAVYSHLIKAELELERLQRGGRPFVELTVTDFDSDGEDEVILSNSFFNLYFVPSQGGCLFELDYKPKAYNLINTLSRFSLVDHFLSAETTLAEFAQAKYREAGDFAAGDYNFMPQRKQGEAGLRLERLGQVDGAPVKIEKKITLLAKQSIFTIEYDISNVGTETDDFWFGIEFNLSLSGNSFCDEIKNAAKIKLVDESTGFDVLLELDKPACLWRFPGLILLPNWQFRLEPGENWSLTMSFRIEE
ncbi:MAG: DUF1926 domain-containing protein [Candidatus Margulisbacteria bacterium]|nr:DUF1926 domain-containing protein [Candidatus Margulisiibacteriota bacterium]